LEDARVIGVANERDLVIVAHVADESYDRVLRLLDLLALHRSRGIEHDRHRDGRTVDGAIARVGEDPHFREDARGRAGQDARVAERDLAMRTGS
jgi:hypothetical protein